MKSYLLPNRFFRKKWVWFSEPEHEEGVDMLDVFSYEDVNVDGFSKNESLTTCIDLTQSLETLWGNMRKGFVRKQIEQGRRRGVEVLKNKNFDDFEKVYKIFRKEKGLPVTSPQIFRENCLLFSAYFEGEMIAGGVFIEDGRCMRTFAYASKRLTTDSGRMKDIIGQGSRMINWEAMKYASEHDYEMLDLGGIAPNNPKKKGVVKFKEAFGGKRRKCFYYHATYSPVLRAWEKVRKYVK